MFRPVLIAMMATLALGAAACSREAEAGTKDNLIYSDADDPVIAAAEREGAQSLPTFWAKFDAQDPAVSLYLVKVGLEAKRGGREFLWAIPLRHSKDEVQVRLVNEPVHVANLKAGSVIAVAPGDIVDWSYTKGGKAYGHFVTRAMMDRVSPEERAEAEAVLAPTPLEPVTP